jgi:hypothetical protein
VSYVEVSLLDVEHEFQLARQQPRHLVPTPKAPSASSLTPDLAGFLGSLNTTQHVLEMFRRTLPEKSQRSILERLANRLIKIASEAQKLHQKQMRKFRQRLAGYNNYHYTGQSVV